MHTAQDTPLKKSKILFPKDKQLSFLQLEMLFQHLASKLPGKIDYSPDISYRMEGSKQKEKITQGIKGTIHHNSHAGNFFGIYQFPKSPADFENANYKYTGLAFQSTDSDLSMENFKKQHPGSIEFWDTVRQQVNNYFKPPA